MDTLQSVRDHVVALIRGGSAYDTFENIIGEFPPSLRGRVPDHAERSAWQILSHLEVSLVDILTFSRNHDGNYVEMNWSDDYWPKQPEPPSADAWDTTVSKYLAGRAAMEALVVDPDNDLFAPFPWGDGQTILREALLVADHQSYHLGEMIILRRLLNS